MALATIPRIDPTVKHVGISKLRVLNATKLRKQVDETLVIQENDTPLAVLLSYKKFLAIQAKIERNLDDIQTLRSRLSKISTPSASDQMRSPGPVRYPRAVSAGSL